MQDAAEKVDEEGEPLPRLAWLSPNRHPFLMREDSEVLMPDERLLERHWLGVLHSDGGGGPLRSDFAAAAAASRTPDAQVLSFLDLLVHKYKY